MQLQHSRYQALVSVPDERHVEIVDHSGRQPAARRYAPDEKAAQPGGDLDVTKRRNLDIGRRVRDHLRKLLAGGRAEEVLEESGGVRDEDRLGDLAVSPFIVYQVRHSASDANRRTRSDTFEYDFGGRSRQLSLQNRLEVVGQGLCGGPSPLYQLAVHPLWDVANLDHLGHVKSMSHARHMVKAVSRFVRLERGRGGSAAPRCGLTRNRCTGLSRDRRTCCFRFDETAVDQHLV